jgi:hypothetical protein
MDQVRLRRPGVAIGLLLVTVVLVLGACSDSDDAGRADDGGQDAAAAADEGGEGGDGGDGEGEATEEAAAAPGDGEQPAAGAPEVADGADVDLDEAAAGRDLIATGSVRAEVEDLDEAADAAVVLVVEAGGYLSGEQTERGEGATSVLTFEVPSDRFQTTLQAIGDLGTVQGQQVSTEDVTEAVIDLEGRIATAEAALDRARSLVGEADSVEQLATYEAEVITRETALEELRGEQRTLEEQVAMSTITATFTTVGGAAATDPAEEEDRDLPTFLGGLEAGWDVVVVAGSALLVVLGFLTPFLPAVVLVVLVAWVVTRGRRRREAEARAAWEAQEQARRERAAEPLVGAGSGAEQGPAPLA